MQFLVLGEARDSIVGKEMVRNLRADVATAVQRIAASGKMQAGGILAGQRKGFWLLEADSSEELMALLGGELIDNMRMEITPVLAFESLGKFFAEHPM